MRGMPSIGPQSRPSGESGASVLFVPRGNPPPRTRERPERVGAALERVRSTCDVAARLELDPVAVVHRYSTAEDRELVGLIASAVAFGNVKALRAKLEEALRRLGPNVAAAADDPAGVSARLRGWKHRVYRDDDLARLLVGARKVQRASGSLGRRFADDLARAGDLRAALTSFTRASAKRAVPVRAAAASAGAAPHSRRPLKPAAASACCLMFALDGASCRRRGPRLWEVPTSALLVPVDVHIHKLGRNLGFTRRKTTSWKTTEEGVTSALRRFDPTDLSGRFALCHLGMLRRTVAPRRGEVPRVRRAISLPPLGKRQAASNRCGPWGAAALESKGDGRA
jgi:hypothetical protein